MSATDRLDEIEARANAATEGPWYWEPPSEESFPQNDESLRSSGAKLPGGEWDEVVLSGWGYDASGTAASDEDRAFIAASRTDIPALVAALRAVLKVCITGAILDDAGNTVVDVEDIHGAITDALGGAL